MRLERSRSRRLSPVSNTETVDGQRASRIVVNSNYGAITCYAAFVLSRYAHRDSPVATVL